MINGLIQCRYMNDLHAGCNKWLEPAAHPAVGWVCSCATEVNMKGFRGPMLTSWRQTTVSAAAEAQHYAHYLMC